MANRCPSCERFVSLEPGDPDVEHIDIDGTEVKCSVRLTMVCADCGEEMREWQDEMVEEVSEGVEDAPEYSKHFDEAGNPKSEDCALEVEEQGVEQTEKVEKRKTLYGCEVHFVVKCACSKGPVFHESHLESSYVSSSEMDEMC